MACVSLCLQCGTESGVLLNRPENEAVSGMGLSFTAWMHAAMLSKREIVL